MKDTRRKLYLLLKRNQKKIVTEWVDEIAKIRKVREGSLAKKQYKLTAEELYPLIIEHIKTKNNTRYEKLLMELTRSYLGEFPYDDMVKSMIALRSIAIRLINKEFKGKELLEAHTIIGKEYDESNRIISNSYIKERESRLREEEERYKTLVRTSPDAVTVTDLEGNIIDVSQRTLQLHGYKSAEELLGKSAFELIAPKDHKNAMKNLKKTLKEGVVRHVEYTLLRKDRTQFIGELNAALIKDVYGKPTAFIATTRDITERKQAEDEIRRISSFTKSILDNAGLSINVADMTGKLISVSKGTESIFGWKENELLGRPVSIFYRKEDRKTLQPKVWRTVLEKGRFDGEVTFIRKNGEEFLAHLVITPLKSEKGEIVALIGISQDITDRKKAEEALHHRFEQLQAIYHISDTVSRAGAIEEIYEEALKGLQRTLKADRSAVLLFDPDGVMRFKSWRGLSKGYRKAVEGHSPWSPNEKNPRPILFSNVEEESSLKSLRAVILGEGIHALGFIPLTYQGRLLGKFMIYYDTTHHFSEEEIQLAKTIASHIAFAIERKRVEEALRESEKRYRAIFEQAADSIVLIDARTGELVEFNDRTHENLGYTREEFKKLKIPDFEVIESAKEVGEHIEKIIKKGADAFETKHRTKTGEVRDILVSSKAISIGGRDFVQSVWRDITDRKQAEEKIISIKDHLQTVIDGIEESIVVIDRNYNIVSHNQAFVKSLRYPIRKIVREKCYNVIHKYKNPCRYCVVRKMFRTGKHWEDLHSHTDGRKKIWHEVKAYPLKIPDGKINQAVYVFRDVTKRIEMEEQLKENYKKLEDAHEKLKELDEMKSEFISMASHELQTPLSIIRGYAELLKDGTLGGLTPIQNEKVENMKRNIDHLIILVGDMLDLSRIESGELEFEKRRINVNKVVEKVVDDMLPLAEEKEIEVVKKLSQLPMVTADRDRISQVIRNLMDNSLKFTPPGGRVTIKTKKDKGVIVEVTDTGVGIPKDELERAFDSFYRVVPSAKSRGLGLGLKICKEIVEAHNGTITLKSKAGKGTTVIVKLPLK